MVISALPNNRIIEGEKVVKLGQILSNSIKTFNVKGTLLCGLSE